MNTKSHTPHIQPRTLAIGGVGIAALILFITLSHSYPTQLMINEVSFTNNAGADWVEIYNPSLSAISLKGYYLSDDTKKLTQFAFTEDVIVPSHGYVVVYSESTDTSTDNTLPFHIKNGETIYLVATDGNTIIDRLTVLTDTDDTTHMSVGRFPDGASELFTFTTSTPGATNDKDEFAIPI